MAQNLWVTFYLFILGLFGTLLSVLFFNGCMSWLLWLTDIEGIGWGLNCRLCKSALV